MWSDEDEDLMADLLKNRYNLPYLLYIVTIELVLHKDAQQFFTRFEIKNQFKILVQLITYVNLADNRIPSLCMIITTPRKSFMTYRCIRECVGKL